MQKDNIKNMNNSDRDTITGNDKSSMVITGIDRTVRNAKGVYAVYQGWKGSRLDSTREPIESVHKGNNGIALFPKKDDIDNLTFPPDDVA